MRSFLLGTKKMKEFKLSELKAQGLDLVMQYPALELYRIIVDGRFHSKQQGLVEYEKRQPGCIESALDGLALAFTDLQNDELTLNLICKLHAISMGMLGADTRTTPGKIRENSQKAEVFGLNLTNLSEQGLVEIFDNISTQEGFFEKDFKEYGAGITKKDLNNKINWTSPTIIWEASLKEVKTHYKVKLNIELAKIIFQKIKSQQKQDYFYIAPSAGNISIELKRLISEYNFMIKQAEGSENKLNVIVKYITAFNRLHPFHDGNIRTFVILLMNRLLLQNGFPIATHFNPNVFDGLAHSELIIKVKESMYKTMDIINGEKDSFGFKSENIPLAYREKYLKLCQKFFELIKAETHKQISGPAHLK